MSCEECEEAQEQRNPTTYYRIDTSNIEIVGCVEHSVKTITKLREADALEKWIEQKEEEVEEAQEKYNSLDKLNKVSADATKTIIEELKEEVLE